MKKNLLFIFLVPLVFYAQNSDFKEYVGEEKNKFNSSKKANTAFNKGFDFFNAGDFENAIEQFTITIEDDKKQKYFSTDAYLNRATAYLQINDFTNAIDDYSAIISFGKDNYLITALIGRAGVYGYLGDFDKGIEDFRMAIDLKPNSVDALYNLSRLYLQKKDYKNGLEFSMLAEKNYKTQRLNNPLLLSSIYYNNGAAKYSLNISNYCDDFNLSIQLDGNTISKGQIDFIKNVCP
jgi:tetratricopeptide (TPR) repeat protein